MKNKKIGLGTFAIKHENAKELIRTGYEAGYDFIDTAKIYKTEKAIGQALKDLNLQDKFPVQTKISWNDFTCVRKCFQQQLKDLQLKKVWTLLLHRPNLNFYETLDAWKVLIELQKEGLVENIGVSNFDRDHFVWMKNKTGVLPVFNQIELSVDNFRKDRIVASSNFDIKIQSWSPMGTKAIHHTVVKEIGKKHNTSPATVLLAFLANQDLCPIVRSNNTEHIIANYQATKLKLSENEINQLHALNTYSCKFEETFPDPEWSLPVE